MGRIEDLANCYQGHISAPWQKSLAAAQRTIFVVYDKVEERKLRTKLDLFEMATRQSAHGWQLFDFTGTFEGLSSDDPASVHRIRERMSGLR